MGKVLQEDIIPQTTSSLTRIREYKVVKANSLIQKSQHNLSVQEQKIVLYLITKIKPGDQTIKECEFSIREFCQIVGIDYTNGGNYTNLKATIKKLADKSFWIDVDDQETLFRWIARPYINKKTGTILLKLDEPMKPYLLQLKEQFTQYSLYYTLAMKSKYSISLYEILKSYENLHGWEFEVDELKEILSAGTYKRFADFKRKVLDVAMNEINELGDIHVKYKLEREGHKFSRIIFSIASKKDIKERAETWAKIDNIINPNVATIYDRIHNEA